MSEDGKRTYFRVPCEMQLRFRVLQAEEMKVFQSFAMRPSPYSGLKQEIENVLKGMAIREESKLLFERGFQILLNIDQRLERIEENIHHLLVGSKADAQEYEWVYGDLSAGGLAFVPEKPKSVKKGDYLLIDMILPSLPEQRMVVAALVVHLEADGRIGTEYEAIHEDDREFLHRFVISRERELLRHRALEKADHKQKA